MEKNESRHVQKSVMARTDVIFVKVQREMPQIPTFILLIALIFHSENFDIDTISRQRSFFIA